MGFLFLIWGSRNLEEISIQGFVLSTCLGFRWVLAFLVSGVFNTVGFSNWFGVFKMCLVRVPSLPTGYVI